MPAIFSVEFERALAHVRRELPGAFGVCAERLDDERERDGERLAWNDERVFPAASVIKIAVALEVLCAIEEGSLDASRALVLAEHDKVTGSGVLSALDPGLRLSIFDALYLAIAISDNTAANLLIAQIGARAVDARLAALGLVTTRLRGRIFVAGEDGERSPATASELVALLRRVHRRDGLPARACDRLLALLARTQTASTIGRGLPDERFPGVADGAPTVTLAYKTGSIHGVVAEAGIVSSPRATYAIALMSEGSGDMRPNHDNVGRVMLGELSRAIHASFTRS